MNYYNEHDPKAAAWLRALITAGEIPAGVVDERSIVEIKASELTEYVQCHFFAGIGGWSLALKLARWPASRKVWTGSCPCQPYSVGSVAHGGAKGHSDSRDLWPQFFGLIKDCQPPIVFGEQVASAIPWGWWDRAASDLEASDYATGAAVLRADSFGARHQRKRLYWLADAGRTGRKGHQPEQCLFESEATPLAINGDPLARARRALDGDLDGLLHCDGVSVVLERSALKGYGNAIVPKVASEFIGAWLDTSNAEITQRGT